MDISQFTELLGWVSIICLAYIFLAGFLLVFLKTTMFSVHQKMMDLDEKELASKYFDFLSLFKILTIIFIFAPYVALKIMGQ